MDRSQKYRHRVYFACEENREPVALGTRDGFVTDSGESVAMFSGAYFASEEIDLWSGYDVRGKTYAAILVDNVAPPTVPVFDPRREEDY